MLNTAAHFCPSFRSDGVSFAAFAGSRPSSAEDTAARARDPGAVSSRLHLGCSKHAVKRGAKASCAARSRRCDAARKIHTCTPSSSGCSRPRLMHAVPCDTQGVSAQAKQRPVSASQGTPTATQATVMGCWQSAGNGGSTQVARCRSLCSPAAAAAAVATMLEIGTPCDTRRSGRSRAHRACMSTFPSQPLQLPMRTCPCATQSSANDGSFQLYVQRV